MSSNGKKRVVIVGGVAGGASCAARMRRMDENAEIIVFEKGPYISYANCGLPYYAGEVIAEENKLLLAGPELFRSRFNIDVRVGHEVVLINRREKTVGVREISSGALVEQPYDYLVLSPGAVPIRPPLPGIGLPGIFTVRTVPDARQIRQWIEKHDAKRAIVIGGGYIGLEMAENLVNRGLATTLIEMLPQVMPPVDPEMVTAVHKHMRSHSVDLRLSTRVSAIEKSGDSLVALTKEGERFDADIIILSIGIRPNSKLAEDAGLALNDRGAIRVNANLQTDDPAIYAIGDAAQTTEVPTGRLVNIPLAGPANRQGRIAADHISGRDASFRGAQATAVVGVFGMTIAMTGISEKIAHDLGLNYEKVYLFPAQHAGYYPGAQPIHFKLLFDVRDGRILGAQAVGREGVEKRIDVISMAIQMHGTVFDLEEAELCYAPQYGSAKDPINMAGFIASNHLRGDSPLVHWENLHKAPFVLDVREPKEFESGAIPNAVNIPLGQLRNRIDELPKDKQIWTHCGVGQRAHYAVRVLRQYDLDARNLSGGWKQYQIWKELHG